MGISSLVTRGFSNGTYVGSIAEIVTVGYLPDNGIIIIPTGIGSAESFGTPSLSYPQLVIVSGIASEEIFGIAIIQDGVELIIPVDDRATYQAIQRFLAGTGQFVSTQNNDIIVEWLKSEGFISSQFNDLFIEYWNSKGFTGAYNDKWKKWRDS